MLDAALMDHAPSGASVMGEGVSPNMVASKSRVSLFCDSISTKAAHSLFVLGDVMFCIHDP
jgi:hypothetical protein